MPHYPGVYVELKQQEMASVCIFSVSCAASAALLALCNHYRSKLDYDKRWNHNQKMCNFYYFMLTDLITQGNFF